MLAHPQTLGNFCGKEDLIAIGQAYFSIHPHERDLSILEELIVGDYVPSSAKMLMQHVESKIAVEFSNSDLSVVNGWVLSWTEARQIALYALLNS